MELENEDFYDHAFPLEISKEVMALKCKRCGGVWRPLVEGKLPKHCAKCNSPYWFKDKLRTGDNGAPNKYGFDQLELGVWRAFPWYVKPDGSNDYEANGRRARALEQFMRRKGYLYEYRNGTMDAPGLQIRRRS